MAVVAVQLLQRVPAWARYLLPSGRRLPDEGWRQRHNALVVLLWAHVVGLPLVGFANGLPQSHSLFAGIIVAFAAVGASMRILPRRLRACIASAGLLACSAILVHLTGGLIESHFHFFVMLSLITLYEDWLPFVLAVGFVVLHHGGFGLLLTHSVYQNPAAQRSPILWAFIHAGYVLCACAANIYAWRLVEKERIRTDDAQGARDEAIEASRLKSQFLATMSHEIRTPMNGVVGLTGLLLDTQLSKLQRQYAEGVEGAGAALLGIIDDILDFSKLEAGKVDLEAVDLDLHRLIAEVADLLVHTAREKNLELIARCHCDVPSSLRGDGGRIRQVLINLVSNALKFTATGEVVIEARLVGDSPGEVEVRFEVSDTGIGIASADAARIFEPFAQQDASTTRRYGGTGLGLAICQRLAEAMHGELGLDSEPGRGSTFWFQVPLRAGSAVEPADRAPAPRPLHGLRVLVVDDNAKSRAVLASQLSSWGANVDTAEGGHAALALLSAAAQAGKAYALAVLDQHMPNMDGLMLAGHIRWDLALLATPLLLLTDGVDPDAEAARRAGISVWLSKPVRGSELYDRVLSLLPAVAAALPAATTEQGLIPSARPPLAGEQAPAAASSTGQPNVLVVEDNLVNQLVAAGILAKLGYRSSVVANGAEAVVAVAATSYAAILMDCQMPQMDGFEATTLIRRAEGGGRRTPIIAMTASVLNDDRARCLAVGMDDYVTKPVDVAAVKRTLAYWCNNESATAAEAVDPSLAL